MPRKQNLNPTLATCPTPGRASQSRMERSHCRPGGSQCLHIDMRNQYVHEFSHLLSMFPLKQRTTGSVKRKLMRGQVWNVMEQPTIQQLLYISYRPNKHTSAIICPMAHTGLWYKHCKLIHEVKHC